MHADGRGGEKLVVGLVTYPHSIILLSDFLMRCLRGDYLPNTQTKIYLVPLKTVGKEKRGSGEKMNGCATNSFYA